MAINPLIQRLADFPLYQPFKFEKTDYITISKYLNFVSIKDDSIDLFCIHCKERSVFKPVEFGQFPARGHASDCFFEGKFPFGSLNFCCSRDSSHYFGMMIRIVDSNIMKIGQYPSKADIELPDYDRFSKILPSNYLSDIKKAIGLSAHGIGAGSFVYLRRVIEYFIIEAKERAVAANEIDEELFQKSRMIEKISLLKNYLPIVLVENKEAYSVLSKGIHELTEDECLSAFSLLKETIELILEEKLAEKIKIAKQSSIRASINHLHTEIKKK